MSENRSISASEIAPRDVEFSWDPVFPLNAVVTVVGAKNIGKTALGCRMTADVTRGALPGAHVGTPMPATYLAGAEVDVPRVLVPRLLAAGADLDLVNVVAQRWRFPRELAKLDRELAERPSALVVLDPLAGWVPGISQTRAARDALEGLTDLAATHRATILLLGNLLPKRSTTLLDHAIQGASALTNVSRATFVLGPAPLTTEQMIAILSGDGAAHDPTARVLAADHFNLGPWPPSQTFSREDVQLDALENMVPRLVHVGESDWSAQQVFDAGLTLALSGRTADSKVQAGVAFLTDALHAGPRRTTDIVEQAATHGIAKRSLERARKEMKDAGTLVAFQAPSADGSPAWWIQLAQDASTPPHRQTTNNTHLATRP